MARGQENVEASIPGAPTKLAVYPDGATKTVTRFTPKIISLTCRAGASRIISESFSPRLSQDRVLAMTFRADSAENVSYTYDQSGHGDGIGRLTSVTDGAGTLSRTYDQFGNLTRGVRATSTATLTTAYTYDATNRIASITYPSGTVVSYTRDAMGLVTAISAQPSGGASAPVVSSITYEPFGPDAALTYGNGVAESRGFDQDYRLTGMTDTGSAAHQNLSYAYHPTNNVHTITDAVNFGNSQNSNYDMAPQFVKPYVKPQKNDANDAEAICEAVTGRTCDMFRRRQLNSRICSAFTASAVGRSPAARS